jgi:hypothetical protein
MPVDPMTGEALPYGDDLDMMAMEQALGGGAPMDPMMDPGAMGDMVPLQVPSWAVPAVEELVSILEAEIASGSITPEMLMDVGGGAPMDPGMGSMDPMMDPGMGAMDPMMGGQPF